jgi:hypothetical protein
MEAVVTATTSLKGCFRQARRWLVALGAAAAVGCLGGFLF